MSYSGGLSPYEQELAALVITDIEPTVIEIYSPMSNR